jgi:Putative porin
MRKPTESKSTRAFMKSTVDTLKPLRRTLLAVVLALPSMARPADPGASPAAPVPEAAPAAAAGAPAAESAKRVTYVPEIVKQEIRDEVMKEVLEKTERENWAKPGEIPEWVKRFKLSMDVRARLEEVRFGKDNVPELDFNAINTNKPLDLSQVDQTGNRFLNVDQNRERPRLRARLSVGLEVGDGFSAGLRLASGDSSSPVSTNQTLGGSAGNLSKYQFWLDRAYIQYDWIRGDRVGVSAKVGRFENPFFATELIWSENVNLDGLAAEVHVKAPAGLRPFAVAGAVPLYISAFDFEPDQATKARSLNRWLMAGQVGTDWNPLSLLGVKVGLAYYDYRNIQGEQSSPCRTDLNNQIRTSPGQHSRRREIPTRPSGLRRRRRCRRRRRGARSISTSVSRAPSVWWPSPLGWTSRRRHGSRSAWTGRRSAIGPSTGRTSTRFPRTTTAGATRMAKAASSRAGTMDTWAG